MLSPSEALYQELVGFCALVHAILVPKDTQSTPQETNIPENYISDKTDYHLSSFLGKGQAGNVYRADNAQGEPVFAVKLLKLSKAVGVGLPLRRTFLAYQKVLTRLRHAHVVKYRGWSLDGLDGRILTEFCDGGTLLKHIRSDPEAWGIQENQRSIWTRQLIHGLDYLHAHGIVHRDIKPSNIFIHRQQIKIGDLGSARIQQTCCSKPHQTKMSGTAQYLAPESIVGKVAHETTGEDLWALGCVIYEMALGQMPWSQLDNDMAIYFHLGTIAETPDAPFLLMQEATDSSKCTYQELEILRGCFVIDPRGRLTAPELLQILDRAEAS